MHPGSFFMVQMATFEYLTERGTSCEVVISVLKVNQLILKGGRAWQRKKN